MNPVIPVATNATGTVATATTETAPTPEQSQREAAPVHVVPPLDAIKEARRAEANQRLEQAAKEVADKAASEALAAKQAEASKAAEADQVKQLTTKLTEAQTQATTLAERAKLAEKLEAASTLAKSGKHYDAIKLLQEATGADLDLAVQEAINPGYKPEPKQDAAKPEDEPASVKALREQVEALTKSLAERDQAAAAVAKEAGRKSIVSHVQEKKDAYPFLASNEAWINKALAVAEQDYVKEVQGKEDLSQEAKNELIEKALAKAEAEHKEQAQNYAKILGLPVPNAPKNPIVAVPKPTLTYTGGGPGLVPAAPAGKVKTLDELKRARRAN